MKKKSIIYIILLFTTSLFSQNLVEGTTKTMLYKNGSHKKCELQISSTETIAINFKSQGLELYYINSTVIQSLLDLEETDDWTILQVCVYDFDKNNVNDLMIAFGDKSINLKIHVFNRNNGQYKPIGVIVGQDVCYTDKNKLIVPYGSQGLYDEYTYRLGEIHKSN